MPGLACRSNLPLVRGTLYADLTLFYCREGAEALCFIEEVSSGSYRMRPAIRANRSEVTLYRDL